MGLARRSIQGLWHGIALRRMPEGPIRAMFLECLRYIGTREQDWTFFVN